MGRPSTSKETKAKRGQSQPVKLNRSGSDESIGPKTKLPTAPKYLSKEARGIWRKLGKTLADAGLLSETETYAFGRYCQAMGLYERLMEELNSEDLTVALPNGIIATNPKLKIANDYQTQADRLGRQFGLSPSSRKDVPAKKKDAVENPLMALLKRKHGA